MQEMVFQDLLGRVISQDINDPEEVNFGLVAALETLARGLLVVCCLLAHAY